MINYFLFKESSNSLSSAILSLLFFRTQNSPRRWRRERHPSQRWTRLIDSEPNKHMLRWNIFWWCFLLPVWGDLLDDGCVATSLLQKSVVPQLTALTLNTENMRSACMAEDLEKVLKGLKESSEETISKYLGFPMILLLGASLLVLLAGHRLVTVVVLASVLLASFFLSFEFFREVSHNCSVPVWGGIIVALLATGAALCFIEVAIIVPGALFGAILAYQIQAILLTASPQLASNAFFGQYYFIIALLAALVFAYIAHKLKDDIFILFTSVLGAYGFEIALRGILLDYFSVKMSSLASLITMLSAFIVGLVVQHKSAK